jgi:enoyl-CoA hydratase
LRTYEFLKWVTFDDDTIVRISLNRPAQRNAKNRGMLVELDQAFGRAEADDTVRVVILAGGGPMFSSGHDLGSNQASSEFSPRPVPNWRMAPPLALSVKDKARADS